MCCGCTHAADLCKRSKEAVLVSAGKVADALHAAIVLAVYIHIVLREDVENRDAVRACCGTEKSPLQQHIS